METSETTSSNSRRPDPSGPADRKPPRKRGTTLLAFATLFTAATLVLLPRPTYPQILPLPIIDRSQSRQRESEELKTAAAVVDGSLERATRSVGEQVRRIGRLLATHERAPEARVSDLRDEARSLANEPHGREQLLSLRALQAELFVQAATRWNTNQPPSSEVIELAGPFAKFAKSSWSDGRGGLVVSRDDLRLFYRIYWGKLTSLSPLSGFAPSLHETRRYYRTLLLHPPIVSPDAMSRNIARLSYAKALGDLDPTYPALLTQGLLQLKMGQPKLAHQLLVLHLSEHPEGQWTSIARNARLFAERVSQSESFAFIDRP